MLSVFVISSWHASLMYFRQIIFILFALMCSFRPVAQQPAGLPDPYLELMKKAAQHANTNKAPTPVLSPIDFSVIRMKETKEDTILVPIAQLHAIGIRVVPWTTNDPDFMRKIIESGADGLITDRPDILQTVLAEERSKASPADRERLEHFDVSAHRGGRRLRPENTLPSFESSLDQLSTTLETDTGVSTDHVSTIWHDQFYNSDSCRRADGQPYTMEKPGLPERHIFQRCANDIHLRQAALRGRPEERSFAFPGVSRLCAQRASDKSLCSNLRGPTLSVCCVLRRLLPQRLWQTLAKSCRARSFQHRDQNHAYSLERGILISFRISR